MTDELHNLELTVEQELSRWSERLDVRPEPAAVAEVRARLRQEAGEAWLAAHPQPSPPAGAVARARSAVAAELARWMRPRRWLSSQGLASLAAAAMLLIAVGVVQLAAHRTAPDVADDVHTLATLFGSPAQGDSIESTLRQLESDLSEDAASLPAEGESLEDLVREIDRILEEHEPPPRTSARPSAERGVWG